jgi:hypothetical protein
LNDSELRELCSFIASMKINKKWTENALFIMLKANPDLIKGWVIFRRDVEKTSKEMVQFT